MKNPKTLEATFATVDFDENLLTFRLPEWVICRHKWRAGTAWIDASEIMLEMQDHAELERKKGITAEGVLAEFVADIEAAYPPGTSAEPDLNDDWPDLGATYRKAKAVLGPTK